MSASVDQCLKAQANSVLHGPKAMKDEDAWRTQAQAYNPTSSNLADPYISSYYASVSFPYLNQGLGDGGATWSNDLTFLSGGYGSGDQASHYMDFGQSAFGSYAHFFPAAAAGNGAGDYSAWGGNSAAAAALGAPRKAMSHAPYHQDYYRESYDSLDHRGAATLKHIEQGMGALTLGEFAKDGYMKPELVQKYADVSGGSKSWATVASQPPAPKAKLVKSTCKTTMDIGTWENNKNNKAGGATNGNNNNVDSNIASSNSSSTGKMNSPNQQRAGGGTSWSAPRSSRSYTSSTASINGQPQDSENNFPSHPVLDKLRVENEYNPKEFDLNPKGAKFFIIKSYSEDDIHRSIKYSIWCSTEHGNKRLDAAFRENKGPVYLLFSVNGSGHFCGMAQMMSPLDYNASSGVWAQDKWKGQFQVKWIYVKDVPNPQLRHIRLENNENKPVTNSRDTQEVPYEKGKQVLKIFHTFKHTTSIFDDFLHYEKRQEEDEQRKVPRRKD